MPGRAALTALASLLLGGCFYTPLVDVSDQRPGVRPASFEAAAAADERPIAARGVTMSDARDFAQLLHDYYGATSRGEVQTQKRLRDSILASTVVAAGGLLFDSHLDLIKGAGLVGGSAYAAGQSVAWSERRKTLDLGMQATHCLYSAADNTGLTSVDVNMLAEHYMRARHAQSLLLQNVTRLQRRVDVHAAALRAAGKSADAATLEALTAAIDAAIRERVAESGRLSVRHAAAMHDLEVASRKMVNRTLDIQRRINLELARLEPDLVAFTRNIRDALGTGFNAISGMPLKSDEVDVKSGTEAEGEAQGFAIKGVRGGQSMTLEESLDELDNRVAGTGLPNREAVAATRAVTAQIRSGLTTLDAAMDHFRAIDAAEYVIDLTVPTNFMNDCSLVIPDRALTFSPPSKKVTLEGDEAVFEIKVIGGVAPHEARSFDESKLTVGTPRRVRENASVIEITALAEGTASISVTDSTTLSADYPVTVVKKAAGGPDADGRCPAGCNCEDTSTDGLAQFQLMELQAGLLALGHFKDAGGKQVEDPLLAIDGRMGPMTRGAICAFQKAEGMATQDGKVTNAVTTAMQAKYPDGAAKGAVHPYEFTKKLDKGGLAELKQALKDGSHATLSDADLSAFEFDAGTRKGIAAARDALKVAAPEDWRSEADRATAPAVPLEEQLDAELHRELNPG